MGQKCPKMGQKVKNRAKMHENWLKNAQKLAICGLKMAKTVYVYITPRSSIQIQLKALRIRFLSLSVHFLHPMHLHNFKTPIFSKISISK